MMGCLQLITFFLLLSTVLSQQPTILPRVDPEADMDFCQISNYHGYNCEEYLHQIETEDGFLLTLHRVNGKKGQRGSNLTNRPPVFLQHGLLADSTCWILNLPNDSLAFILSDQGYDVWVGNSRGNTYSKAHVSLKPDQQEFWAWSWDEMALYDLPASLEFVISQTNVQKIPYIGHSQGTLIAFTHLSITPDSRISEVIALGPVFHVGHITSPIRYLAPIANDIAQILDIFGVKDFLPHSWYNHFPDFCNDDVILEDLCKNLAFALTNFDNSQLNLTRLPVFLSHFPAGTSVRNVVHFAQMVNSNDCSRFDFGSAHENRAHYGVPIPPAYNISNVTNAPVTLMWAEKDTLADPQDVQYIINNLPTLRHSIEIPNWDHIDFLLAIDAKTVAYNRIVAILNNATHQ